MSAFTSRESRDLDGWLMSLPGRELPPSFSESFFASSAEMERFNNSDAYARNRWDVVQQQVDRFRDLTGEALPNPENIMGPQYDADRARQYQHVRERFDTYRQQHPDADLTFPDDDALHRSAVGMMTKAKAENRALDQQREAAGGSAAAWWGECARHGVGRAKGPHQLGVHGAGRAGGGPASSAPC
ncbi:hypothetical protein ACIU1J_27705 [Azospirillum doebereinerae]|uniref:hypothetical protein n=1 Tax=Azospirillum doebereinerae TaxID=92933 RepID=UPI00384F8FF0